MTNYYAIDQIFTNYFFTTKFYVDSFPSDKVLKLRGEWVTGEASILRYSGISLI